MNRSPLLAQSAALPLVSDSDAAADGLEEWRRAGDASEEAETRAFAAEILENPQGRRLLEGVFGNSPFLSQCLTREPEAARRLFTDGPEAVVEAVLAELRTARSEPRDDAELTRMLRIGKRRMALAVALADITGIWDLPRVTRSLSDFADAALDAACTQQLRTLERRGALRLRHADDPTRESGLIIIAMGKLGARELNYSSDIDLIVLFDPERIDTDAPEELQHHFIRLTRNLVKMMEELTRDGYVFRTDLRLRPDPGSTPVAMSVLAAETYYESVGQNWERAAMIKARPAAGDIEAGEAFLAHLKPYVWRKNLDFGAIRDVHAIKRQINAKRGGATIKVGGHNIKLGRGGIREIEFFAQTQQLIWGGREPRLRMPATVEALAGLAEMERTEPETAAQLTDSYAYLRRLEHRLQMIRDEQTQTLPESDEGLRHVARFMGYETLEAFSDDLLHHLRTVEEHYAALFEESAPLIGEEEIGGNLVFTGSDPDPDTFRTLENLGYRNPAAIDSTVRAWHHARYGATANTRAREILTELMPKLLKSLSETPDPDAAFLQFDEFLSRLPAGVQLFSMIRSNPHLLDLLAEIMGTAPRLAKRLSLHPSLLESVLSTDFTDPLPGPEVLDEELDRLLAEAVDIEDVLNISRRWNHDRRFQVGVQMLRAHITPEQACTAYSSVAETALSRLAPRIEAEFARRHGRFPGAGMVIIGMGKLGGREMTAASDLDLIFVYDHGEAETSDGDKPLSPGHYYARLSQRLINAVTAQTAEGALYEVDMRLRPSGKAGPIAVSRESFDQYQRDDAWTWEHMALTRARPIAGEPRFRETVAGIILEVLTAPRDPDALLRDVATMRRRMDAEHHTEFIWEVKHLRGGLVDIEFLAQYLQLRHAHDHPEVLARNTRQALLRLRDADLLEAGTAETLVDAFDLWQGVQGMLRLTIPGYFTEDREADVPEGLRASLARLGRVEDFDALKEKMRMTADAVHTIFQDMVEEPARALGPAEEETA